MNQNKTEKFLPAYKLFANTKKNLFNFDQFKTPTMIITGEKDMNSTPAMSLNLNKKIKNSKLLIIPKGKHMAYHENSVSINSQIKTYLQYFMSSLIRSRNKINQQESIQFIR